MAKNDDKMWLVIRKPNYYAAFGTPVYVFDNKRDADTYKQRRNEALKRRYLSAWKVRTRYAVKSVRPGPIPRKK